MLLFFVRDSAVTMQPGKETEGEKKGKCDQSFLSLMTSILHLLGQSAPHALKIFTSDSKTHTHALTASDGGWGHEPYGLLCAHPLRR